MIFPRFVVLALSYTRARRCAITPTPCFIAEIHFADDNVNSSIRKARLKRADSGWHRAAR
jgi:hypothetical protein